MFYIANARTKVRISSLALTAALATLIFAAPVSAGEKPNTVIATIAGFTNPFGIVVDHQRVKVYVTNAPFGLGAGFISVIDEATNTVTATLTGFTTPTDMVLDPLRGKIYVNNYIDDGQGAVVSVIDEETNAVTNITLPVPGDPKGIALDPFRGKVYVGVQEGYAAGDLVDTHYLAVIDEGSNTVVNTIQLPDMPEAVGIDPLRGTVYVANSVRGPYSVLAIDERNGKILANIPMPSQSQGFAVDADRGLLYVASDGYQFNGTYLGVVYNGVSTNGTVTVVDERTKTITDTIVTGPASGSLKAVTERVVLDPENGPLYATNFYGGSVVVIDPRTHKVTDTITTAVGGENNGIDIDLVSRKIYVADYLNGNVNIIKAADARPPFYEVLIHDWAWYTAHAYP